MVTRRQLLPVLGAAAVLAAPAWLTAAAAGPAGPGGKSGGSAGVVLELAVAEYPGKPAAVVAETFAERVESLSNGSLKIVVRSRSARLDRATSSAEAESSAIGAVRRGEVELGIFGSHAFEAAGVASLRALQAPFLVTDSARAERATAGAIAERLQGGLSAISLQGLALVPNGFERPFGFLKPLETPADFAGVRIRADSSKTTRSVLRALGARPVDLNASGSETAIYGGFVNDASSVPYADDQFPRDAYTTGNLTLFPTVDVIVVSSSAFGKLRADQRSLLRRAAAEARAETIRADRARPAAHAFCRAGGTIVRASASDIRRLLLRVAPLRRRMRREPVTGALVAQLERLPAGDGGAIEPCGPTEAEASPPEPQYTRRELRSLRPPAGSYRRAFSAAELRAAGADEAEARRNAGVTTLTFYGPPFSLRFALEWQGSLRPPCRGRLDFPARGVELRWNPATPCNGFLAFRWQPAGRGDLAIAAVNPRTRPRWLGKAYPGVWKRVDCTPDTGWPGPAPGRRAPPCLGARSGPPPGVDGDVAYAPDGMRAAFARTFIHVNGVWLTNVDGSEARALTSNRVESPSCPCDRSPSFSPDGTRIAFLRSSAAGSIALFVMGTDGDGLRQAGSWTTATPVAIEWSSNRPRLEPR